MESRVRLFSDRDYETVCSWWSGHGNYCPELGLLPPCGVIATIDGQDAGAVWMYKALGCGVCHAHWLVMRPGNSIAVSRAAGRAMWSFLKSEAISQGYGVIFGYISDPRLEQELNKMDFHTINKGITGMISVANPENKESWQ